MTTVGDYLNEKMEELDWTQKDLAYVAGVTSASINQVSKGKRSLSVKMTVVLSAALGVDPLELAALQARSDIAEIGPPDSDITVRAELSRHYPIREMLKRGWVDDESDESLESQICDFFSVEEIGDIPHVNHSAKKTATMSISAVQLAWLHRVKKIASEMIVPDYSENKLKAAIDEMRLLLGNSEEVRHVPRLLSESGVRFVIVECLPNSKIDGACLWLDKKSPVVAMSLRYDRIDNFWFVLRHECAHVLHRHGLDSGIVDANIMKVAYDESEEESVANAEASDFCVPKKSMDSFFIRKNPFFSESDLKAFAKRQKVHPGLVAGQLHRRLDKYNIFRQHLVPVKEKLMQDALIDGFGQTIPVG